MSGIKTHKDLDVWKEAIAVAKEVYKLTESFPQEETYGLTSQMRRAAVSIASNIAEGAARNSTKEFIQSLYIALGSLAELETQLLLARELEFVPENPSPITDHRSPITDHRSLITDLDASIVRIRKMLLGLIKHLKRESL